MFKRKIGHLLSKLIPHETILPILRGPLKGYKWIASAAAGEGKGLSIILNFAESQQLSMAKKLSSPDGICFDIGANVGFYTLLFSRYSKQVFAFEPLPRNIMYLSKIISINKVQNAIIVPCAISDQTQIVLFKEGENCALGRIDNSGKQPVAAFSCDDFVSVCNVIPSLIKIDVEGGELLVLKGARNLLQKHKPTILLSTHGDNLQSDCFEFLKNLKYSQIIPLNNPNIDEACEFAFIP